jgi:hypothetical protein
MDVNPNEKPAGGNHLKSGWYLVYGFNQQLSLSPD